MLSLWIVSFCVNSPNPDAVPSTQIARRPMTAQPLDGVALDRRHPLTVSRSMTAPPLDGAPLHDGANSDASPVERYGVAEPRADDPHPFATMHTNFGLVHPEARANALFDAWARDQFATPPSAAPQPRRQRSTALRRDSVSLDAATSKDARLDAVTPGDLSLGDAGRNAAPSQDERLDAATSQDEGLKGAQLVGEKTLQA